MLFNMLRFFPSQRKNMCNWCRGIPLSFLRSRLSCVLMFPSGGQSPRRIAPSAFSGRPFHRVSRSLIVARDRGLRQKPDSLVALEQSLRCSCFLMPCPSTGNTDDPSIDNSLIGFLAELITSEDSHAATRKHRHLQRISCTWSIKIHTLVLLPDLKRLEGFVSCWIFAIWPICQVSTVSGIAGGSVV